MTPHEPAVRPVDEAVEAMKWALHASVMSPVVGLTSLLSYQETATTLLASLAASGWSLRRSEPDEALCPAGCKCRLWTDDADRNDCGCDGPCCWNTWDDFMVDVLQRPWYYRQLRTERGEPILAAPPRRTP